MYRMAVMILSMIWMVFLMRFDRVIDFPDLKAVHLYDSINGLGSHEDRHAKIGEGQIGLDAL